MDEGKSIKHRSLVRNRLAFKDAHPDIFKLFAALRTPDDGSGPLYHLPVDLKSREEKLTDVEIIVGPARGAEMLMSGIRSIRAVHPSKSNREFLAQVLATGSCPEEK